MRFIIKRTGLKIDKEAEDWLINMANGDARQAITMLENTNELYKKITIENLKNTLQSKFLRYDKKEKNITIQFQLLLKVCGRASRMRLCIIWRG